MDQEPTGPRQDAATPGEREKDGSSGNGGRGAAGERPESKSGSKYSLRGIAKKDSNKCTVRTQPLSK